MSTQIIPLKDRTDLRESAEWGDTVEIAKALRCECVAPTFISMSLVLSALRANAAAAGIDLPKYLTVDPDDKPAYAQWRRDRPIPRGRRRAPHQTGQAADARMKRVDLNAEPIDAELRACIEEALAVQPGARVIRRKGHLFIKMRRGSEILAQHLYAAKQRWIAAGVEDADLPDEDKWLIFNLLIHFNARLEHVPGVGIKVTLPARAQH